jgi:hypothetical protein
VDQAIAVVGLFRYLDWVRTFVADLWQQILATLPVTAAATDIQVKTCPCRQAAVWGDGGNHSCSRRDTCRQLHVNAAQGGSQVCDVPYGSSIKTPCAIEATFTS